jgi:hypothetical protein
MPAGISGKMALCPYKEQPNDQNNDDNKIRSIGKG